MSFFGLGYKISAIIFIFSENLVKYDGIYWLISEIPSGHQEVVLACLGPERRKIR
jgi:hypothetical protein